MLKPHPDQRKTASECLRFPWFTKVGEEKNNDTVVTTKPDGGLASKIINLQGK
jgi:hypothetical protein